MKILIFISLLTFISFATNARQLSSTDSTENKFYIGAGITTVTYHVYYDDPQKLVEYKSGYFTPFSLNLKYHLNERARIQLGLAYGGSKASLKWSPNHLDTDSVKYEMSSHTYVFAIPITMQFVFLKFYKRFPVYGTASIMPALSTTKGETTEIRNNSTTTQKARDSGINIFATAGLGFNYKISNRFDGYAEYLFYKKNLTGKNSFDYDWDLAAPKARQVFKSLAIGINYSL